MYFAETFQLTAPQGGWPSSSGFHTTRSDISTHSPTRGLTFSRTQFRLDYWNFNSQPHKGGWLQYLRLVAWTERISTHSPTRGLTISNAPLPNGRVFQLTAPQGGWRSYFSGYCNLWYFNSQPHKGADVNTLHILSTWNYFNSQPHKGADVRSI